jgi:DNA/RNA-binding domain of Phe-tRNA-synthetase-like protein
MSTFRYDADLLVRFPYTVGGVILAKGMRNQPTPPALAEQYLAEQRAVIERIGTTPLSEIRSLSAWRGAFRQFGTDPTKYRSAPEALLRRLTKKGDIPLINTLVDIGNLVSIRYGLPVAVFDTRGIQVALTVHVATGTERYTLLGETEVEHPYEGEVIFSDESGVVMARRWCWRQSEESAATLETQNAIITVEAQHIGGEVNVRAALEDLLRLLGEYAGGQFQSGLLGQDKSVISSDA